METRLTSLESRLDLLEDKFAKKLQETRPIWVDQLISRMDDMAKALRSEMEKGFRELSFRIDALAGDVNRVRGYQRHLEERLSGLEREHV